MHDLILEFEPSGNISALEVGFSSNSAPGLIKLLVRDRANEENKIIFAVKWNVRELLLWLRENADSIIEEPLPKFISWNGSIADSIANFYQEIDVDQDEKIDRVFEYRQRHEICFALRGIDVPIIYIGRTQYGWEVSGERDEQKFRYLVDLPGFFSKLAKQFNIQPD